MENDILSKPADTSKAKMAPKKPPKKKELTKKRAEKFPHFPPETLVDMKSNPKTTSQRISRMTKQVQEASGTSKSSKPKSPVRRRILKEKLSEETIVEKICAQTPVELSEENDDDAMKTPLRK